MTRYKREAGEPRGGRVQSRLAAEHVRHCEAALDRLLTRRGQTVALEGTRQSDRRDAVREHRRTRQGRPVCSIKAACIAVDRVIDARQSLHNRRQADRARVRVACNPGAGTPMNPHTYVDVSPAKAQTGPGMTPTSVLRARLEDRREGEIVDLFDREFTHGGAWVVWADDLEGCDVRCEREKRWNQYGSCDFPLIRHDVRIDAMRLRREDLPGGKRYIGGLVTLGARRVSESEGVTVWRATWAAKSRGVSWRVEHGWIAEADGETAHGDDIRSALRRLRRRLHRGPGEMAPLPAPNIEGAIAAGVIVRMSHARRAGLCEPGIRAFIDRHGLDPKRGATIPELERILRRVQDGSVDMLARRAIARAASEWQRKRERGIPQTDDRDWAAIRGAAQAAPNQS